MGHSLSGAPRLAAPISHFYTPSSWIDGKAEDQLTALSLKEGVLKIAAFPDLHPGKYGPVGAAILADRIFPQLVGNDIGCGMSLFLLDIQAHRLKADKTAKRLRALSTPTDGQLGTIGGGNHFCEVQTVGKIHQPVAGVSKNSVLLLVHSGSRAFGQTVFSAHALDAANGLSEPKAVAYLAAHNQAVRWASANRKAIAERAAKALRCAALLICDVPHNLVEATPEGWLHRKGAAKADQPLVPLAGSRDAPSYLLLPSPPPAALASLAHGAGRKFDRASMKARVGNPASLSHTRFGGRVVCEDKQMLVEEAPKAYKKVQAVVADIEAHHLAKRALTLHPFVTFKKAVPS